MCRHSSFMNDRFSFVLSRGQNALGIMDPRCNLIWKLWTQLNAIIKVARNVALQFLFLFKEIALRTRLTILSLQTGWDWRSKYMIFFPLGKTKHMHTYISIEHPWFTEGGGALWCNGFVSSIISILTLIKLKQKKKYIYRGGVTHVATGYLSLA